MRVKIDIGVKFNSFCPQAIHIPSGKQWCLKVAVIPTLTFLTARPIYVHFSSTVLKCMRAFSMLYSHLMILMPYGMSVYYCTVMAYIITGIDGHNLITRRGHEFTVVDIYRIFQMLSQGCTCAR